MQKGALVPTPEEEYWNATANGKLYMMGGNQGGKNDRVLEYDIAADKMDDEEAGALVGQSHGARRVSRKDLRVRRRDRREPAERAQVVGVRPGSGFVERAAADAKQAHGVGCDRSRRQNLRDRRQRRSRPFRSPPTKRSTSRPGSGKRIG
jgi:hypothetical protein